MSFRRFRTLSFAGCRTRAEAEARLRRCVHQVLADAGRKLETDLLMRDVDPDDVDAARETGQEMADESVESLLREFRLFHEPESGT